jgi:hypothetical protein
VVLLVALDPVLEHSKSGCSSTLLNLTQGPGVKVILIHFGNLPRSLTGKNIGDFPENCCYDYFSAQIAVV